MKKVFTLDSTFGPATITVETRTTKLEPIFANMTPKKKEAIRSLNKLLALSLGQTYTTMTLDISLTTFPNFTTKVVKGEGLCEPERFLIGVPKKQGHRAVDVHLNFTYDEQDGRCYVDDCGCGGVGHPHPGIFLTTKQGKGFVYYQDDLFTLFIDPLVECLTAWYRQQFSIH